MPLTALTRYRKRYHLTQAMLGAKLDVSHATIGRWEAGKRAPRMDELIRISKRLGLRLDTLVNNKTK